MSSKKRKTARKVGVWDEWEGVGTLILTSLVLLLFFAYYLYAQLPVTVAGIAASAYAVYVVAGLPLLVRPYLRKTEGGATRDREHPYIAIPLILLAALLVFYEVGKYYFGYGEPHAKRIILGMFLFFLLIVAGSFYYLVILPKVFYHNFHEQLIVKPLSSLKTVLFVLPFIAASVGITWFITQSFFEAFSTTSGRYQEPLPHLVEMEASFAWAAVPVYLVIWQILNRVGLRSYLIRTKFMVSRDDQLPYFIIPTLITIFSVFLFDAYRYNLGAIQIEQMRFSLTLVSCGSAILVCLGYVLPRKFYFRFQELAFAKQPPWNMVSGCHISTLLVLLFVIVLLPIFVRGENVF